ncbi:hypothetical protein BOTBODRAFT_34092 [Botryobasidium botryosum FD-172 SS1]|uniref:F-box domain-containing protein n=1 Tax=Botryobasidium botryosum (strain FD-172 SS1) TaxID=930990 RepID=A0A067MM49_BOTB1|nr:hypothetical protein BOTBODRAFT_34092 [Botryobasidium botryosum FD-172 SS1]
MASLPIELVHQVMEALDCSHPSAYRRNTSIVVTLCRLSLVSRSFHAAATPHLYRSVALVGSTSTSNFARTVSGSEKHTHVQAILFDRFWEEVDLIPDICTILHAVAPSLQRLFLAFPLLSKNSQFNDDVFRAFDKLSLYNLVELASGYDNYNGLIMRDYPAMESRWTRLRRLALQYRTIDNDVITALSALPALEVVAILSTWYTSGKPLTTPLPPSLRQVVVLDVSPMFDYVETYFNNRMGVERGAPIVFTRVPMPPEGRLQPASFVQWPIHQVAVGKIWEADKYKGAITTLS